MFINRLFVILGALGVICGAFGAHALKTKLTEAQMHTWSTATLYLFIHVIAGLLSGILCSKKRSQICFLLGVFLFSGSLYTLILTNSPSLGIITPAGGILFIVGWLIMLFDLK